MNQRLRGVAGLLLALALAGCGGLAAPPQDTFYRLQTQTPAATVSDSTAPVIFVPPFAASGLHGERALVYAAADGVTLEQSAYHFWTDSPRILLQQALADRLGASVARLVLLEPSAEADYVVRGRIRQFERTRTEGGVAAQVTLELTVERPGRGLPELQRTYAQTVPLETDSTAAFPAAASVATAAILDEFIHDFRAHLGG